MIGCHLGRVFQVTAAGRFVSGGAPDRYPADRRQSCGQADPGDRHKIGRYTLENRKLAAITRHDQTIVARIRPVAESYVALLVLDALSVHCGYQMLR